LSASTSAKSCTWKSPNPNVNHHGKNQISQAPDFFLKFNSPLLPFFSYLTDPDAIGTNGNEETDLPVEPIDEDSSEESGAGKELNIMQPKEINLILEHMEQLVASTSKSDLENVIRGLGDSIPNERKALFLVT